MSVEEQVKNGQLQLDEKSQADILESEFGTDVENISSKLGGYQRNSEKKKAWIVSIEFSNNKIIVEFLLPSTDTFVKEYDFPDKRLPEDNLFRKLIEETGCNINTLELSIGEDINIRYNELDESWEPKIHQTHRDEQKNHHKSRQQVNSERSLFGQKYASYGTFGFGESIFYITILSLVSLPIFLLLLRYTRGYDIFAIIVIMIGYYLISTS
jgi:hypothetical protein